ncbi:hypothetical protein TWF506_000290 [Arthrobotrys conoides]|uniref:Uncharacterized protein n=1 Tax=Arthrobotrys conoides TaxID=74498 RepID=A0AAN8NV54_9PEZI
MPRRRVQLAAPPTLVTKGPPSVVLAPCPINTLPDPADYFITPSVVQDINKLTIPDDYKNWSRQMRAIFHAMDLWPIVTGPDDITQGPTETAAEFAARRKIETKYEWKDPYVLFKLMRDFVNAEYDEDAGVDEYAGRLRCIQAQMLAAGSDINDDALIARLADAVPEIFKPFIDIYFGTTETRSFNALVRMIRAAESRHKLRLLGY